MKRLANVGQSWHHQSLRFLPPLLMYHPLQDQLTMDPAHIRTQRIYFLIKTHKTPPLAPTHCFWISSPTEKLSRLVDWLLRPALAMVPSLLVDSRHLINILETTTLSLHTLLATLDVKSLYKVIPQQEGIDIATRQTCYPPRTHLFPRML